MDLTQGERLIILMLCDLFKQLKVKSETDPDFVAEAIFRGQLWAIEQKYSGIFHGSDTSDEVVRETGRIMAMWSVLEDAYQHLHGDSQERFAESVKPWPAEVHFRGFDGNGESEFIGVAHFMIKHLERFREFEGRELNAHMPTLAAHRRMLEIFEPLQVGYGGLSFENLVAVVKAQLHPENRG